MIFEGKFKKNKRQNCRHPGAGATTINPRDEKTQNTPVDKINCKKLLDKDFWLSYF